MNRKKQVVDQIIDAIDKLDVDDDSGIGKQLFRDVMEHNLSIKNLFKVEDRMLDALYALGYSQYKQHQYKSAGEIFHVLVCMDHKNLTFIIALGMCFQMRNEYDHAIKIYLSAIHQNPKFALGYLRLCECYFKQSNWDMFSKSFELLTKLEKLGYVDKAMLKHKATLASKYEVLSSINQNK